MVVSVLTCYAWLHTACHLKAVQMNVQYNLSQKLILHKFELGRSIQKHLLVEDAVDHSTVITWFKKFHLSCKNCDNQGRSGKSKTVDFNAIL